MKYWDRETIDKIRKGYYSAVYFNRTKHILEREKNYKRVTVQVFQKNEGSILCGVNEVLELLKVGTGYWEKAEWVSKFDELKIESLKDGDKISAWETVMHISGPYAHFAHLESLYLGILARRTLVATNVRKVVTAAKGKQIIFFADRFDHFLNQEGDGYAAHIGGASAICTEAMGKWWGSEPVGTIPHSLIAINNGDTVESTKQFMKYYPDINVIALVDFDNDCVKTSLEVARVLGDKLWGVRLDTAENLIDQSLLHSGLNKVFFGDVRRPLSRSSRLSPSSLSESLSPKQDEHSKLSISQTFNAPQKNYSSPERKFFGVNPSLVRNVRNTLDKEGFQKVKIIVSGGFNEEKIKWFQKERTPVDVYGVGSALVHGANDFTADVVKVEDRLVSKEGRKYNPNNRLKNIT